MKIYCPSCMKTIDVNEVEEHKFCGLDLKIIKDSEKIIEEIQKKEIKTDAFEEEQIKKEKKSNLLSELEKKVVKKLEGKESIIFREGKLDREKLTTQIVKIIESEYDLFSDKNISLKNKINDIVNGLDENKINWRLFWSSILKFISNNYKVSKK